MEAQSSILSILLVLITILGSLSGCGSQEGTIRGTVQSAQDGAPIARAEVYVIELMRAENVTDMNVFQKGEALDKQVSGDDGGFSFTLDEGDCIVEVWVEGQKVADRMVNVEGGQTNSLDFDVEVPSP